MVGKAPRERAPAPALKSYTPKHLAEKILASKNAMIGERKQVTVLFADLKSSMELLSETDAEQASKLLDSVLEIMMEAVHSYEGIVNQVMGDGIMALFGVPLTHEDHAIRACYAALRMQEAIKRHAAEMFRTYGVNLRIRVGINSGEVVVRAVGSDLHTDYTAVGQTTHLAARMEKLATVGSILLAPATLQLAEGYVSVTSHGRVPVKGMPEPVEVYELTGVTAVRSRLHATAMRGLSPFVGRQQEIAELQNALEQARGGHGQIVAMIGDPGVGKSRLYWEFLQSHHVQGFLTVGGSSVSYGKATAYFPVIDLLKGYFQVEARDDNRRIREKITGKILSLDRALEPTLPALLSLLDVAPQDAQWDQLDALHKRRRILDSVKRVLLRESQEQPLIVVFEDLHWIDSETQSLLDGLVESIATVNILLLVNYRPEYQNDWARKSYCQQNHIRPLEPQSMNSLLEGLLGNDVSLNSLKRQLIEKTEGNPLFIEESVRILVETHAILGEKGQYRLGDRSAILQIPSTVQTILSARMDRLRPEDKNLLQIAAVIGKDVQVSLLAAIADVSTESLHASVERLIAAEFLYELRLFPEIEYTFSHALTREAAHQSLLRERRTALHARAAQALLQLSAERIDEHIQRVALHAEEGEQWEMAWDYLERSGTKLYALHANAEAAYYFERALAALSHCPDNRGKVAKSVDLRFALRNALLPLGRINNIREALQHIDPMLAVLNDDARNAKYAAFQNNHHFLTGDQKLAIQFGMRGLDLARDAKDKRLESELLYRLAQSFYTLGDYKDAVALLNESLAISDEAINLNMVELTVVPTVINRVWLVATLIETGEFEKGIRRAKEALKFAEQAQHPLSEVMSWWCLGNLLLRKGETDGAVGALERGKGLCDQWDFHVWRPRLASSLGIAYARSGRTKEGVALTEEALAGSENMGMIVDQAMLMVRHGQASLIAGQVQDAITFGTRAAELATSLYSKGDEAWARFLVGRAYWALLSRDLHASSSALNTALNLAIAIKALPLIAHCHMSLGHVHQASGNDALAKTHIEEAIAQYAELNLQPLPVHPVRQ